MREAGLRGYLAGTVAGASIGLLMGVAERIPGASAAAIAIAFGVYAALLATVSVGLPNEPTAERGPLIGCGIGLLVSLVWGGEITAQLLLHAAVPVRAFFFGLIAAAVLLAAAQLRRWGVLAVWLTTFGALAGMALAHAAPEYSLGTATMPMLAALVCASAALVPGGFGSTVLALSGVGDALQVAWQSRDGGYLATFGFGAAAGLLLVANLLRAASRRFPDETYALLLGLMGSGLAQLWPWQRIDAYTLTLSGEAAAVSTSPMLPWHYFATTGADVEGLSAVAVMGLAMAIVMRVQRAGWQPAST